MNIRSRIAATALAGLVGLATAAPRPAAADGAATTRNLIFGAAAIGGTLLVVNHNKKVHQKYAEYDQRQAQTQSEANQAQAAYESERRAYTHEVALVEDYRREVAYEHVAVRARDRQIASLEHSLIVAKANARPRTTAFVQPAFVRPAAHPAAGHVSAGRRVAHRGPSPAAQVVSYGWGSYDQR